MTFLTGDMALKVRQATGRETPSEKSVQGLARLPTHVVQDIEAINQICGGLAVFAYLYHVTDASFGDIKEYLDKKGWLHGVDE